MNRLSATAEPKSMQISVIILTHNEEINLPDCLRNICDWAREIFVVDSGSTDGTREIAREYGASVVEHAFETHSQQWAWALQNLPIQSEWVLGLDADQRVTPELAVELRALDSSKLNDIQGIYMKRRQVFRDRWIRHGGYYPKYLLKLFRKDAVFADARDLVDHHFYVSGKTLKLRNDLIEINRKEDDITFWIEKHNRYATLLANEEMETRSNGRVHLIAPAIFGNPDQRALKCKQIWTKMPLYLRPFLYFFYRYVIRLGFLDGKEGAIFHFLQAFWFRLLIDIKIDHMEQRIRP